MPALASLCAVLPTATTTVTDARGNPHDAAYDSLGQRISLETRDTGLTEYRFTVAGDLGARITPNLRAVDEAIRYEYDFHRLRHIDYPASTDVTLEYGAPGAAFNRAGRLARRTDGSGSIEFRYGALGETVRTDRTLDAVSPGGRSVTATTQFTYDSFARMLDMTFPDGERVEYGYNLGGQLQSVTGVHRGARVPYVREIQYDEFLQRT